ncbi:hypothetical protein ACI1TM_01970 [Lactococcus garvieae]|uniref:hypothetical protein n=1 Tax=Lactococcus garvieae TaxID=1363 RepID=UPI00385311AE
MTSRKNIWDILTTKEFDVEKEYTNLWELFQLHEIVKDEYGDEFSFEDMLETEFLKLTNRMTFTSYKDLVDSLGLRDPREIYPSLDDLDRLIEVILFIFSGLSYSNTTFYYEGGKSIIMSSISALLELTNQKIIVLEGGREIVVPSDETATIVSDLILPENESLALDILGYSHYSKKDDVDEKRRILQLLANYLEPKLEKNKSSNISFLLNKYFIRHGDDENRNNVDNMSIDEVNNLYDKLYREILYYILEQEHKEFEVMVTDMKQNYRK